MPNPFGLSRADKLICEDKKFREMALEMLFAIFAKLTDNALGGVGEIPKLSFPKDQSIGIGHGITKFKAQYTVFRQGRIADGIGSLIGILVT